MLRSALYGFTAVYFALKTLLTDSPATAAALLRRGQLVAFPTETVYGLGADARNARAVLAIYDAKKRPADNPLIVHLARLSQIDGVARDVSPEARKLIDTFFPGPLTLVLRRHAALLPHVTAHLDTVAIRVPAHALAHRFLHACACPVAAPSAKPLRAPKCNHMGSCAR